ncbi:probable ATP-dependent RNA helicase DHX35 [Trichoplusia ni]|uniref:RNA helicase n=1 Tax=Trichoplusia ni TaxID=7111 RepID=A0A7E5WRY1_TRINI|nr:probable ATP-dependent RNA helicase DHX35 [Trichoplusia ni]
MLGQRPRFIKPGDESLYPTKNKDGAVETLVNPNADTALSIDNDSRTSFVYNRYHHLPLTTQRQRLPVFQYKNHILYLLERYQTLVLIGETGCGKSTQVPQYLHDIGHRVCVTQPRVAAAVSLASRVADERDTTLGDQVGYAAAGTSCRTATTGIMFMTEGVLLREMFASPLLMQYSCIVLDEVHERTQMTDVLMGLLKKIIKKRKTLKLVISSATMDAEFLRDFFNLNVNKKDKASTSVIMSMEGRTHPIDVFYTEEPVPDYVKATVETVIKIHENEPFGDILAFLTSQEEILTALETLQIYSEQNNDANKHRTHFPSGIKAANLLAVPMYGSLPHYKQIRVFQRTESNVRKIVLATNVAETSITIPGIVYVIDCGFHKLPYFSPAVGVESLAACPVARDNAAQRAGRCGRTQRGKCYRLYTEAEFDKLSPSVPPEMCRSDLSSVLLQLKALGIDNLLRFTFPTPPPAKSILSGLELLYALQCVDSGGGLSAAGERAAELPLRAAPAVMLLRSGEWGCIDEALSIAAMLQVDSVFLKPSGGKEAVAARVCRRNNFEVAEGDIIMYLNILEAYLKLKSSQDEKRVKKACKQWCQKYYINHRVIEKACEVRDSLEKLIKGKFQLKNKEFEEIDLRAGKTQRVMKCVLSGYFPQAAYLSPAGSYRGLRGATLHVSPDSCLFRVQQPKWVMFASVQSSGDKTYMREMMTIEQRWLLDIAPHYYKLT